MYDTIYWEHLGGNGPPIVILHGWGQSSEATYSLGRLLTACGDVHLVDLPGFGRSPLPNGDWDTFDYAECLCDAMAHHGIASAIVIGHSFGGKVGLCLSMRHPERVLALGLLATSGVQCPAAIRQRLRKGAIQLLGKATKAYDAATGMQFYQQHFIPRFGSADYRAAGAMRGVLVKTVTDDLTPHLPQVQCPCLLLWGEGDKDTPIAMGEKLDALLPQSRLVVFPEKGHQLLHDVGSHLCAKYLIPFCRQVVAQPASGVHGSTHGDTHGGCHG